MKYSVDKLVVIVFGLIFASLSNASQVGTATAVTVRGYNIYVDIGGGDVLVLIQGQAPAGCEDGFWLRPSDAAFKSAYATIIMAYTTKSPVIIYGYNDQLWPGSASGHFCRLSLIAPG